MQIDFSLPARQLADAIQGQYPVDSYTCAHASRYAFTLKLLRPYVKPGMRILDIGFTRFTDLLHEMSSCAVDSMSNWPEDEIPSGHHYSFDLNLATDRTRWRSDIPQYDLIVFSEVVEHLHISPHDSVAYLTGLLKPGGTILIQTPNAVSWTKRAKIFLGKHPYQMIEPGNTGDCHIREYTLGELDGVLSGCGLNTVYRGMHSYFDQRRTADASGSLKLKSAAVRAVNAFCPPGLRPGITLLAQRPS